MSNGLASVKLTLSQREHFLRDTIIPHWEKVVGRWKETVVGTAE